jgi:hypothetical protein
MSDQERVVYPFGTSGRGYRLSHRTYIYFCITAIFGFVSMLLIMLLASIVPHDHFLSSSEIGLLPLALLPLTFAVLFAIAHFCQLAGEPISTPQNNSRGAPFALHAIFINFGVIVLSVIVSLSIWQSVRTGQGISMDQGVLILVILCGITIWRGRRAKSKRPMAKDK